MNINHSPTSPKSEVRSPDEERVGDKIIALDLADKISEAGELEKRRMVNARVNEIILGRLSLDAKIMESEARTEKDIQKMHQLMDTAKCLRVAMTWINGPEEGTQRTEGTKGGNVA